MYRRYCAPQHTPVPHKRETPRHRYCTCVPRAAVLRVHSAFCTQWKPRGSKLTCWPRTTYRDGTLPMGLYPAGLWGRTAWPEPIFPSLKPSGGTRSNAVALIAITSQAQSQGSLQADEIWLFLLLVLELFFQRGYLCLLPHAHY